MRISLVPVIAGIVLAAVLGVGRAYTQGLPATSQGQVTSEGQTVSELTAEQLDQLLAPIALYPDDLLSDILMAATYPLEVVEAANWLQDPHNALLSGDQLLVALEKQDWDPSVKSLAPFPRILRMMDDELGWTEQLGEAFIADQAAVMDSVQRLRQQAQSAGRLASFPEATVTGEEQIISIEPSTPDLVYVPICDPSVVYGDWPYPAFPPDNFHVNADGATVVGLGCRWLSAPIVAPLWGWQHFHWRKHDINIERSRFAVLNGNQPPIAGDMWGHDPSHRHNVEYRDPGLRARFVGATPLPEARSTMRGFPTFPVPRVSSAPPLGPALRSDPATDGIEPTIRRRIPPPFEPFGRGADVRRFPTAPVPWVNIVPSLGPAQTGESTIQKIEPPARTHVSVTTEPLGRRASVRIQTELGISRRTFAPAMDPRAGARRFLPSGASRP